MAVAAFTVTHTLHPRFRDTDAMGHINNAVYVTYLEVARQEYWKAFTGAQDYRRVPFILAHVTIDFRSEALMDEVLELGIRCAWIGSKSFAFAYEIRETASKRLVVEATTVQVCYDYTTKTSIPVPDDLRRELEAFEGRGLDRTGGPATRLTACSTRSPSSTSRPGSGATRRATGRRCWPQPRGWWSTAASTR